MEKVIFQKGRHRIVQVKDTNFAHYSIKMLIDSWFRPEKDNLDDFTEVADFVTKIMNEGSYGYIYQRWNPETDKGWTEIHDSWGFIGEYNQSVEEYNHYVIEDYKKQIDYLIKEYGG